jgi:signal transduction histidine kinase
MMPEVDGLELTRRIRADESSDYTYIILLTAKSEKEDLVQAMEAGADDFLIKPCDQDELRVRIHAGERIIRLEHTLADQNRQLRETQAALVQSEKLASLGQLAAGMAHEINNPISYVANNLAVLQREVTSLSELLAQYRAARDALADVQPELARKIAQQEVDCDVDWIQANLRPLLDSSRQGLSRVRDIVKQLRDFARLDEAELDELNLNDAVRSTLEVVKHEMQRHRITAELALREDLPKIVCRPAKLHQVLYNLLLNAIQASQPDSRIVVRTLIENEQQVAVEIEDFGCGIDPGQMPRIFEPFFTTKPVGRGTGLGLAVTYGIVRDHGGTIEVTSEVDRGSTFRVRLPLRPPRQ